MSSNKYQSNQLCTFAAKYNLTLFSWYVKMISQIRNEVSNKAISFPRSFDIKRGAGSWSNGSGHGVTGTQLIIVINAILCSN